MPRAIATGMPTPIPALAPADKLPECDGGGEDVDAATEGAILDMEMAAEGAMLDMEMAAVAAMELCVGLDVVALVLIVVGGGEMSLEEMLK